MDNRQPPCEETEGGEARQRSDATSKCRSKSRSRRGRNDTAIPRINHTREGDELRLQHAACRRRLPVLHTAHLVFHLVMPSPSCAPGYLGTIT